MVGAIFRASGAALLAASMFATAGLSPVAAQEPTAVQPIESCPVPLEDTQTGIAVCVDRGEGSEYREGDPITICVTAALPVIAIFPPPPPPTIVVTNSVNGGPEQVVFETAMHSGQVCVDTVIVSPTGSETVRAAALGNDGQVTYADETAFQSVPSES